MKKYIIIFMILILSKILYCEGEILKVEFDFLKNCNFVYEYKGVNSYILKGITNQKVETTGEIFLKVNDFNDKNIYCTVRYKNFITNDPLFDNICLRKFSSDFEKIDIEVILNEKGAYIGLKNYEEVRNKLLEYIEEDFKNNMDLKIRKIKDEIIENVNNKELFQATYVLEPLIIFNIYGIEINIQNKYTYDAMLPNMLEGENFPAKIEISCIDYDEEKQSSIIFLKSIPEKKEYNRILKESIKNKTGKIIKDSDLKDFEIDLEYIFEYDMKNKIISKITTKKLATSSFDMKNDESTMSLKRGIK